MAGGLEIVALAGLGSAAMGALSQANKGGGAPAMPPPQPTPHLPSPAIPPSAAVPASMGALPGFSFQRDQRLR